MTLRSSESRHPEPREEAINSTRSTLVRRLPQGVESKIFGGWGITL